MTVAGTCDPAFAAVREVFAASVAEGRERGAVCLRVDGRTVVDLWGGAADPETGAPWGRDTLACCFSVTKGVFALLAHVLIDRGVLDPEAPVAALWPEFGAGGKVRITVRDALTHRAGLPAVSGEVPEGSLYDTSTMERLLEASEPVVPPSAAPVYHNMTYGYLVGGIVARACGVPVEQAIAAELTGPLGADFRIGLTDTEIARCARLTHEDRSALFAALDEAPATLFARSMAFFARDEDFNTARWRRAVIGSGNGHTTAEGLARLYEAFHRGPLLSPERRAAIRTFTCESDGPDPILGVPVRYGEGVELSLPPHFDYGPDPANLGYWGSGGAQAFSDAAAGLAFGYVTGHKAAGMGSSDRARALVAAAYGSL